MHGVSAGPVLEVDAALRKHLLHRFDELVYERIEFLRWRPRPAQAEIEGIVEVLLIVRSRVEIHRQKPLGREPSARGVELELADRNPHAVGAEVAEAEDAPAIGHGEWLLSFAAAIAASSVFRPRMVASRSLSNRTFGFATIVSLP